jgi:hypothetical protein
VTICGACFIGGLPRIRTSLFLFSALESYKTGHPFGSSPLSLLQSINRSIKSIISMTSKYISQVSVPVASTSTSSTSATQRQAVLGLPEPTKQRVLEALLHRINESDWKLIRDIIEQEPTTNNVTGEFTKKSKQPKRNWDLIRRVRASGHIIPDYKNEPEGSSDDGEDSHLNLVRRYREECGAQVDC